MLTENDFLCRCSKEHCNNVIAIIFKQDLWKIKRFIYQNRQLAFQIIARNQTFSSINNSRSYITLLLLIYYKNFVSYLQFSVELLHIIYQAHRDSESIRVLEISRKSQERLQRVSQSLQYFKLAQLLPYVSPSHTIYISFDQDKEFCANSLPPFLSDQQTIGIITKRFCMPAEPGYQMEWSVQRYFAASDFVIRSQIYLKSIRIIKNDKKQQLFIHLRIPLFSWLPIILYLKIDSNEKTSIILL